MSSKVGKAAQWQVRLQLHGPRPSGWRGYSQAYARWRQIGEGKLTISGTHHFHRARPTAGLGTEVIVTGTGFPANDPVDMTYDGNQRAAPTRTASGNWSHVYSAGRAVRTPAAPGNAVITACRTWPRSWRGNDRGSDNRQ